MKLSHCCDAEVKFGMVPDRVGHGLHEETECSNCGELFPKVYDDEELIEYEVEVQGDKSTAVTQHKLYTEEQMVEFINFYNSANPREYGGYRHPTMSGSERSHNNQTTKNILNAYTKSITPIKLPSDEEIVQVALQETNNLNDQILFNNGAIHVCKLIEEQILKQKK